MHTVESSTLGHKMGKQAKKIYAKPAFFYKNSFPYTSIEVMLIASFPLLSALIVTERVVSCESYSYILNIFVQIVEGFIISFIFYYLNIANEKEEADVNALYTITKLHVYLNSYKSKVDDEVYEHYKNIQCKGAIAIDENPRMILEVCKLNAYVHKLNADIEYFMHPMNNITKNSNFMINLFVCDINIQLNELKHLKINSKTSKMTIYTKYKELSELIYAILSYIDDFTLKFSDSEMVKQRLKSYTEYIKEYFKDLEQQDHNT